MKYLIVGCGRMGAEVAQTLVQSGHAVTLVDEDRRIIDKLAPRLREHLIVGSGFDRDSLMRAGIEKVDGLAAITGNDESNAVIARLARVFFHVPRVVARLNDPRKIDLYRLLGIQIAAPFFWAVNRVVDLLSYSELEAVASLGNGEVEILQVQAHMLLEGRKISSITVPGELQAVALTRKGKTFLPTSETILQCDDLVHLAALADSAERVRAILSLR